MPRMFCYLGYFVMVRARHQRDRIFVPELRLLRTVRALAQDFPDNVSFFDSG